MDIDFVFMIFERNKIINKSKLFQVLYFKKNGNAKGLNASVRSDKSMKMYFEDRAMEHHRVSLKEGRIGIDQWKAHSVG